MKQHKQAFRHRPEEGEFGDCLRTCIACVLELDRDAVPNFGVHANDKDAWDAAYKDYLQSQGLARVTIPFGGEHPDDLDRVMQMQERLNPGVNYLLTGTSANGTCHVVVANGGTIVWDPAIDNSGIVGPVDGLYWIEYLVPAVLTRGVEE